MASPFAVFRRNQRILLAVSGITAMIAFVFLDPIFKMLGGPEASVNPLVVKTNYGNYRRFELDAVVRQRRLVEYFLQRVVAARVKKEFAGKQMPEERLQMVAKRMYESIRQGLMGRLLPPGDAAAVETIVLAKRAEEMGMVASDRAVNDLLQLIAGDVFSQLRDIIAELRPDGRIPISQTYLFDGLQREMLASQYTEMFRFGTRAIAPRRALELLRAAQFKGRRPSDGRQGGAVPEGRAGPQRAGTSEILRGL